MDGTAVNAIRDIAQAAKDVRVLKIGERDYTDRAIMPVEMPAPKYIGVATLTAIKDYLTANPDALDLAGIVVVIENPAKVGVISKLFGSFRQRDHYLIAAFEAPPFPFGQFIDIEKFIIGLQAHFLKRNDVEIVLQAVGNVTDGVVKNFDDSGVTQSITVKAGITRREEIAVPNPVLLAPYRTFPEVDQPPSNFIFRMKGGDQAPTCALFEADGGAWKAEAAKNVKEWLTENLPKGVTILA